MDEQAVVNDPVDDANPQCNQFTLALCKHRCQVTPFALCFAVAVTKDLSLGLTLSPSFAKGKSDWKGRENWKGDWKGVNCIFISIRHIIVFFVLVCRCVVESFSIQRCAAFLLFLCVYYSDGSIRQ